MATILTRPRHGKGENFAPHRHDRPFRKRFTSVNQSARVAPYPYVNCYSRRDFMATVQAPPPAGISQALQKASPASQGIDEACLERLYEKIDSHMAAG